MQMPTTQTLSFQNIFPNTSITAMTAITRITARTGISASNGITAIAGPVIANESLQVGDQFAN
jgi:hypothetical protein